MNSQYALEQLPKVIEKLLAKTEEGKVPWTESQVFPFERTDDGIEERFSTTLDNDLVAQIEVSHDAISFFLVRTQPEYRRLLELTFNRNTPRYGFDSADEESAFRSLNALYGTARRCALNLDAQIENAVDYLNKLGD